MKQQPQTNRACGFTLTEVVTVIAMVGIITLGVGILLANGQKSWGTLFGRVYGDSAVDSFAAHKAFDTVCRKSSRRKHVLSESGDFLELYYWDHASTASTPENYARFYQNHKEMVVEYGKMQTGTWQPDAGTSGAPVTLARDVESLTFAVEGTSVQMFLNYSDAAKMPVVCSSVRHND
ncbi:MAG: type II secretion system protein [Planctomycetota bacterium]|jgi:prepilin-type N-terminal cleavage/methylation domain-containing protein